MTDTDNVVFIELWGGPRDGEVVRLPSDEAPMEMRIPMPVRLLPPGIQKGWFRYRYSHMRGHFMLYTFAGEHHL